MKILDPPLLMYHERRSKPAAFGEEATKTSFEYVWICIQPIDVNVQISFYVFPTTSYNVENTRKIL